MNRPHLLRRVHRALVPLAAVPLLLTALTGSLYGALSAREIEAFWLIKLHTGNFGAFNLQPYYSTILGILTIFIACSGAGLLFARRKASTPSGPS